MKKYFLPVLILLYVNINCLSQPLIISNTYFKISASANDPLYTTYAAAMERSQLYGDKAYKMDYFSDCLPINYSSDQAGKMFCIWKVNGVVIDKISEYYKKPVVIGSFPDMAIIEYEPYPDLAVQETFFVYSSTISLVNINIKNNTKSTQEIDLYPILMNGDDSLQIKSFDDKANSYITNHYETKKRLISNLSDSLHYPTELRDVFMSNMINYTYGGYKGTMAEFYDKIKFDFYAFPKPSDSLNCANQGYVNFISLHNKISIQPGEQRFMRFMRGVQGRKEDVQYLITEMEKLKSASLQPYLDSNLKLFVNIPSIGFFTNNEKLIYLSAFNLARGSMLPPSGNTTNNYYVFSRNPLWGWGHGHQCLHESLSMLAYAFLDSKSAEGSQRVFIEQQAKDGLIAYRHGPLGAETFPAMNKPSTCTPFFNWINWEVYKVSKDKDFLEEAYDAGEKYVNWIVKNRDINADGTFEWGPNGIVENARDWYNAVFQVTADRQLDVEKGDISDSLDCLDLTVMIIKEMRSLSNMAKELGKDHASRKWTEKADAIMQLVNDYMWDKETGFYYSVDKNDHSFKFQTRDLRRQEIIGFLPLWAEATTKERADTLVKHLTDPNKFWREFGVPSLAADDIFYNANVDYCCKWNGPVWLLWDYMVFQGLLNYGYKDIAKELANKMILCVTTQLSKNHNFWESYSPDNVALNCPSNYIWDCIMARLLIDVYGTIK